MAKETKIKTFALRIEADQMEAIEKWAADEFRSVNGQIQYLLSEALKKSRRMPKQRKSVDISNKDSQSE